ncbi:hypothetical protein EDB86DRAFT_2189066 [Lactarius hatsudake]|nr:hypothetical protein EDB86DRAFT_2189066 [Lactarius hatsudake]
MGRRSHARKQLLAATNPPIPTSPSSGDTAWKIQPSISRFSNEYLLRSLPKLGRKSNAYHRGNSPFCLGAGPRTRPPTTSSSHSRATFRSPKSSRKHTRQSTPRRLPRSQRRMDACPTTGCRHSQGGCFSHQRHTPRRASPQRPLQRRNLLFSPPLAGERFHSCPCREDDGRHGLRRRERRCLFCCGRPRYLYVQRPRPPDHYRRFPVHRHVRPVPSHRSCHQYPGLSAPSQRGPLRPLWRVPPH